MVEGEDWDEAGRVRVHPELLACGFSFGIDFSLGRGFGLGRGFCFGVGFEVEVPPVRVRGAAACGNATTWSGPGGR